MPKTTRTIEPMTSIGIKKSLYERIIKLNEKTGKHIFFLAEEAFQLLEKKYENQEIINK